MRLTICDLRFVVSTALAVAWLPAGVAQQKEPGAHKLDLATVLRLAGAQSLDVEIAREKLAEAKAGHEAARTQFFPWISPGIGYRRHDGNIQDVTGNVFNTSKQSYTAGATIGAQLELGDAIYKTLAAKQTFQAAGHGLETQRQESIFTAAQNYFDLLKSQAAVGVADVALKISQDYAGQVARAVEAGIAFKGDALRARVQAERNQMARRQAGEQRRVIAARLAQELHLPLETDLSPTEEELAPLKLSPQDDALDSLVALALAARPELKQSEALVAAARHAKDGSVYGPLLPSLGAQAFLGGLGGGVNQGTGNFRDAEDYLFGLSWRIGPGGIGDRSRIRLNEARLSSLRLADLKLRDEITRQVVESQVRAQSLADQLKMAKNALAAAEETLKLTRERKEFSVGIVLEHIQAEQELTRARNDYLALIAENNKAQFALQRALGRSK